MIDVCNMEEIANIEIHKDGNRYYLCLIANDEISGLLKVEEGCWTNKRISYKNIVALCNVIRGDNK